MTPGFVLHGWSFDFGKGIAYKTDSTFIYGLSEVRFRIKKNRVVKFNGTYWDGSFFSFQTDKEILQAYEHWIFERIVLNGSNR